ncbi:glycosyltransferase family 39 protein [Falsiroseomonas oryziterrae]|uniref:glycosyltransferase family 39 protein n=1 Tax=Falsiroseomonas oryziterrae TaxID=2911368 RepID=UPI001F2DC137|nr:glycosyltransferase family 39 protein [Roseomonas sp. NPKOSM-4]
MAAVYDHVPVAARPVGRRVAAWAGIAACLALAVLTRLRDLGAASLWGDELATLTFAAAPLADLLGAIARAEPNPPAWYLLMKLVAPPAGGSDFALRLPAALLGAIAVVPLALATRTLFGSRAALLAAALLALSAVQVYHAQQIRAYALVLLSLATALWLLGRILADQGGGQRRLAAAGFALACLVAVHAHATAAVMVAALFVHALVVLALRRRRARPGETWQALTILAVAGCAILVGWAWWLRHIPELLAPEQSEVAWIPAAGGMRAWGVAADVLLGFHLGRLKPVAALAVCALLAFGAWSGWRRDRPEAVGLAAATAFGFAALVAASAATPVLLHRTAMPVLVFALPLVGFAATQLRPRVLGFAAAAMLILFAARGDASRAADIHREGFGEDWRGAIAMLATRAAPGDIVVFAYAFTPIALPHYAPEAAPRLRVRVGHGAADRLYRALRPVQPGVLRYDEAEACGRTVWTLARWLAPGHDPLRLDLPPPQEEHRFLELRLRRHDMPACPP